MSRRFDMLPDERPRTVWRPGQQRKPAFYRFNPRVPLSYVPPLIVLAALGLLAVVILSLRTPVVLYVDGDVRPARVFARTAGGALRGQGLRVGADDTVWPDADTRLEAGMLISVQRQREVLVYADGGMQAVQTRAIDPPQILADAGLSLAPADILTVEQFAGPSAQQIATYPALADAPALPAQIRVRRAVPVGIDDGGELFTLLTAAPTVGLALLELDGVLHEADSVQPAYGTRLSAGMQITIRRAQPVVIEVDGRQIDTLTTAPSVGRLLDELRVVLSGDDYVLPPADTPLTSGMQVQVVRIGAEVILAETPIPYETIWQPDPTMVLDEQLLVQAGQAGVLQTETRVRYEDAVEVSRVVVGERVVREPLDEVMAYGTQIVIHTIQTDAGPVDYWRHLRMLATSYTAATSGKDPGDPGYGITATGQQMRFGIVAVDPRLINYFSEVYVPGYGRGLAADTGGAIRGLRLDLGYDEDNLVLWYDWVDVYLLPPVPDPADMIWVITDQPEG